MRQWQPPGIHVCASWRSGRLRRVPRCGQDPEQCAGAWRTLDLWLASRGTALLPLRARTKAESRRWRESVQKGLFRESRRIDERIRFLSCSSCHCSVKDLIPETNEPKRASRGAQGPVTNFASLLESLEFRERDQNDRAGKGLLVSKHNGVTP